MRVISLRTLREFWERYPDAEGSLRVWYRIALHAEWHSLSDVRQTFPHADAISTVSGTLTVFNIRGNHYRLITRIRYEHQAMTIRAVLTHKDYDRGDWKE
jgi:Uncharacterized protein conserved in bacteria